MVRAELTQERSRTFDEVALFDIYRADEQRFGHTLGGLAEAAHGPQPRTPAPGPSTPPIMPEDRQPPEGPHSRCRFQQARRDGGGSSARVPPRPIAPAPKLLPSSSDATAPPQPCRSGGRGMSRRGRRWSGRLAHRIGQPVACGQLPRSHRTRRQRPRSGWEPRTVRAPQRGLVLGPLQGFLAGYEREERWREGAPVGDPPGGMLLRVSHDDSHNSPLVPSPCIGGGGEAADFGRFRVASGS